jgi:hypothetical protein
MLGCCHRDGIPEIQVDSIDPATVNYVAVNISGVFDVKGSYKNVMVKGLSEFKIVEVKSDLQVQKLVTKIKNNNKMELFMCLEVILVK